jgi:hypothetical protein
MPTRHGLQVVSTTGNVGVLVRPRNTVQRLYWRRGVRSCPVSLPLSGRRKLPDMSMCGRLPDSEDRGRMYSWTRRRTSADPRSGALHNFASVLHEGMLEPVSEDPRRYADYLPETSRRDDAVELR